MAIINVHNVVSDFNLLSVPSFRISIVKWLQKEKMMMMKVGWVACCCPSLDVRQPRIVRKLTYMNGKCQNVDCFYCIFLCFLLCQIKFLKEYM